MPPGWIQEETKSFEKGMEQKKRHSGVQQSGIHAPLSTIRPHFGKVALQTSRKSFEAEAHSLHPLNNNWTGLCTSLRNGNAACFSPKLAGPSWMFFLTLYQKCNWQPGPHRQCNVTCSFKQPLVSIPCPFWDTIVYFYTLNTFPSSPLLGECRKRDQICVGAFECEVGESCKCSCF